MGRKKVRRVRKIELPTDSVSEFQLGGTAADIQGRREEREVRERKKEPQKQREEARREKTAHLPGKGLAEKHERTDRRDTEMDTCTEGGGEACTSQSHSRHKKGHMTNINLTDSDGEAFVDFVKDHKELSTRLMNISRKKQRRSISGRGSPTVTSCLSRCTRPCLSRTGQVTASSCN